MFAIQTCVSARRVISIAEQTAERAIENQDITDRRIEIRLHADDVQPVFGDEGPHHLR